MLWFAQIRFSLNHTKFIRNVTIYKFKRQSVKKKKKKTVPRTENWRALKNKYVKHSHLLNLYISSGAYFFYIFKIYFFLIEKDCDQANNIINTKSTFNIFKKCNQTETFLIGTILLLYQYYHLSIIDLILEKGMLLLNAVYYNGIHVWAIQLLYQIEIFTW